MEDLKRSSNRFFILILKCRREIQNFGFINETAFMALEETVRLSLLSLHLPNPPPPFRPPLSRIHYPVHSVYQCNNTTKYDDYLRILLAVAYQKIISD